MVNSYGCRWCETDWSDIDQLHAHARQVHADQYANAVLRGRQTCQRCGSKLDPDGTCPLAWEEAQ